MPPLLFILGFLALAIQLSNGQLIGPSDRITDANRILNKAGLPEIPKTDNIKVYCWSVMASGVFARFPLDHSYIKKLKGKETTFTPESPLPNEIKNGRFKDVNWFTPRSASKGRYIVVNLTDSENIPQFCYVVIDEDKNLIWFQYSWN